VICDYKIQQVFCYTMQKSKGIESINLSLSFYVLSLGGTYKSSVLEASDAAMSVMMRYVVDVCCVFRACPGM
jgi:hypothetical protein